MRPTGEELLRGMQDSLITHILPELQTAFAQMQVMLISALLGVVAGEWDGAAQRLVDDNAALRELARRGAEALAATGDHTELADALGSLAQGSDPSLRLSELSAANAQLRAALAQLGAVALASDRPALRELRPAILEHLQSDAEARSLSLLGPRADG